MNIWMKRLKWSIQLIKNEHVYWYWNAYVYIKEQFIRMKNRRKNIELSQCQCWYQRQRDWIRDDGVITWDDSIEMNEQNNESNQMWVELRLHLMNKKIYTRTHI